LKKAVGDWLLAVGYQQIASPTGIFIYTLLYIPYYTLHKNFLFVLHTLYE